MDSLRLQGRVRKVGNSLAVLIPAEAAREAGLHEGDEVGVSLEPVEPTVFGLLKGVLPYEPFDREELYDD
ncbi:MAG: AbrB/MazE/SpoVT family DNA-binding domain-containing protein [Thermoplasmatota archaeon]|nr:AbrB/MazE/SpoVT family DNA-binding domain-containing protein [Halobacteriales archaeon]